MRGHVRPSGALESARRWHLLLRARTNVSLVMGNAGKFLLTAILEWPGGRPVPGGRQPGSRSTEATREFRGSGFWIISCRSSAA